MSFKIRLLGARGTAIIAASVVSLALGGQANADFILIESNSGESENQLGTFTGSLDYAYDAIDGDGRLIVTLTNTSPGANGGFLTGFIFNIDSVDANRSATLVSSSHPALVNAPDQSGSPFGGPYDGGAAIGGNFLGGGSPSGGIAVGETGTFEFDIDASDASTLTASSFLNGPLDFDFLARFRGFNDGGSDKVPGQNVVPGPSVLITFSMALLMFRRRRSPA